MGGIGSGNWHRSNRKNTVEESLTLAIWDFCDRFHEHSSGAFSWTWGNGNKSSVGYRVTGFEQPIIELKYRWRDKEDVEIPIRLQATPTNFQGRRWWFTCPLVVSGAPCNRRVGKLYLPLGAQFFGCRKCHDLTYRSSQEAHQEERMFNRVFAEVGGYDASTMSLLADCINRFD